MRRAEGLVKKITKAHHDFRLRQVNTRVCLAVHADTVEKLRHNSHTNPRQLSLPISTVVCTSMPCSCHAGNSAVQ